MAHASCRYCARVGSTALLTDHYELTMLRAALRTGAARRRSVFELFPRSLPTGRRYGVVAGVGRMLDALEEFRFDDEVLGALDGVVDQPTLDYLATYAFTGSIRGYPEGELYFPHSPLLTVEASFAEAVVLETLLLSIYNHDSAIASAASRMVQAARGRPCIEMGSRRTHEEAAVASARAAWIAGFEATSNLMARHRFEIPSTGTSAHSFTLLHDTEEEAFRAQVESLGASTTLLVDTYDVSAAVALAVEVAGPELGAVRLDSGDLGVTAQRVRAQLDSLGAPNTKIVVTSDLDEFAIAGLAHAPVDAYGVGTNLVVGSGHPTCGFVYKLVARENDDGTMRSVAKKSTSKTSVGGRKVAARRYDERGTAVAELVGIDHEPGPDDDPRTSERPLLVDLVSEGRVVGREQIGAARERHAEALATMPLAAQRLSDGQPAIETIFV